jgi:para-nitrobenzyl esterase
MQALPMETLRDVYLKAQGLALQPTVDGRTMPANPFAPAATPISQGVPLMMGTVEHEVNFFPATTIDPIEDADLHARVKQAVRVDDAKAKEVIDLYKHGRPTASNVELYQIVSSDNGMRVGPLTQAERKADQGGAPVYSYYFRWQSSVRLGKLRCYHCLDIPFAFDNVEVATSMTGTLQSRYALATKMSTAFASFARNGDPNGAKGLPTWPKFDTKTRATMVVNDESVVTNDPFGAERQMLAKLREGNS